MIANNSPWIAELRRTRPAVPLEENIETDVVIVGGGIAGVTSAFFILRNTDKKVVLVEAGKIAHGATGHNAGQLVSYFERPFHELVDQFGFDMAIAGQRAVESAWGLIDDIIAETNIRTPLYRFTGYAGFSSEDQLMTHFKNNIARVRGGLPPESIFVARESDMSARIPEEYKSLYSTIPHADVLALLETENPAYFAVLSYQKGCMNSALFTEELIGYLIKTYPERFSFYEESRVSVVELEKENVRVRVGVHEVVGKRVLLCTNGFENFKIENKSGEEIDPTFHHLVNGRIGYMAGYVEPLNSAPTAISYFATATPSTTSTSSASAAAEPTGEVYFYLTRRPHQAGEPGESGGKSGGQTNLVCTGGPEKALPNDAVYSPEHAYSEEARWAIDDFLYSNYKNYPEGETKYSFFWHGLMGYTPNGIRRIGPEPRNPLLLYNLGCNGVGILPSVYGSKRIADIIRGVQLEPSIFDPH